MKGLFFFKDAHMCVCDENTGSIYLLSNNGNSVFTKEIEGKEYSCTQFNGFVKYDGFYVGIPMFVNKLLSMIDTMNLSDKLFMYEVEIDAMRTGTVASESGVLPMSAMLDSFTGKDVKTMPISVHVIDINLVSALYVVDIPEMNVLHITNVYTPEPMLASCNVDLYTDGAGCLLRPSDDGGFEKCPTLLDEAIKNHGQLYVYPDMTLRIARQVCCKQALDEIDKIIEGIPTDTYTENTLFAEVIAGASGGNSEESEDNT